MRWEKCGVQYQTCDVRQLRDAVGVCVMDDLLVSCNSNFIPLCCLLQGPPLGQRAGQNNQAKDWELPPERSSPLSGKQRSAGPHH